MIEGFKANGKEVLRGTLGDEDVVWAHFADARDDDAATRIADALQGGNPGVFMTVTVDDEMNVVFHQEFDADWNKVERAMRAIVERMQQQFRDKGKCPFAPIDIEIKRFSDGTPKPYLDARDYDQLRDDDRFLYNRRDK